MTNGFRVYYAKVMIDAHMQDSLLQIVESCKCFCYNRALRRDIPSGNIQEKEKSSLSGGAVAGTGMTEDNQIEMMRKLDKLRMDHRKLDEEIYALTKGNHPDEFSVFRLKKEKLRLRDQINSLERVIYPDIIA